MSSFSSSLRLSMYLFPSLIFFFGFSPPPHPPSPLCWNFGKVATVLSVHLLSAWKRARHRRLPWARGQHRCARQQLFKSRAKLLCRHRSELRTQTSQKFVPLLFRSCPVSLFPSPFRSGLKLSALWTPPEAPSSQHAAAKLRSVGTVPAVGRCQA